MNKFSKPCTNCGNAVHARSKACKICGVASPWIAAGETPPGEGVAPATPLPSPAAIIPSAAPTLVAPLAKSAAFVALADFRTVVDKNFVSMKKGSQIPHHLVEQFKAQGLPIESSDSDGIVACPHCNQVFALDAKKIAARRAATAA